MTNPLESGLKAAEQHEEKTQFYFSNAAIKAITEQQIRDAAPDLLEALEADDALIKKAQEILSLYLQPDGLSADEAINKLLSLLDGPEQRMAKNKSSAAIAKARGVK